MAEASSWIAIVDDDPGVLRALSRLLRSRGFCTRSFKSGWEFLAAMRDDLPACLITDLQMPEMNGLELKRHLARNGVKVPTILITAHGAAVLPGFDEGDLVANFRKPVNAEMLLSAIDRALGGPRNAG
jgi:FixJ family two-component response regulator